MPTVPIARPWRVLVRAAAQDRHRLFFVAVALLCSTSLPLITPLLIRRFVDQAGAAAPLNALIGTALAFLAIAVAAQVADVVTTYVGSLWSWQTTNRLREEVASHALSLDYTFHGRHTAGEMIERVDGDIVGLAEFLSQFVLQAAGSVLLLAGTLVLVTLQNVQLGFAFATLIAIGAIVLSRGQHAVVPLAAVEREAFAQLYGGIEEHLGGAEDIRALGAGAHVLQRFHETAASVFRAGLRWQRWGGLLVAGTSAFFALATVALLAVGVLLERKGAITLGTVVALVQYSQLVRRPVEQLVGQAKQFQQAAASTGRVAQMLAEQPTIIETDNPVPLPHGPLRVRLHGVTFAYGEDPPVLHNVNLEVAPGRTLGLVGRTGSGKTTIGRLLLRLYDVAEGAVEIGGIDIRAIATTALRARVRAVTQDVQVFNASVAQNVTLFDDGIDPARVATVLNDVGLGSWLDSLPDGVDTLIGPSGIGMSAGEAQLLALSRVFLADPAVVVFDEPSSRLDPITERLVEQATARLIAGRTAIVIAHRMAALAHVDDVAVLDHGRVIEHGPRVQLIGDPTSHFSRLLLPQSTS